MPKLSPAEIYKYCRMAGFSPDESVTMTAVSLAESSGNTGAHVTPDAGTQEDSVGLFQINRLAHDWSHGVDLTDPLENAKAAFKVSGGGENISPWTVTHRSNGTPYKRFREEALQAAISNGEGSRQGYFDGVSGYGDVQPASLLPDGGASGSSQFDLLAAPTRGQLDLSNPAALQRAPEGTVERFLGLALAQAGDQYVLGAVANADDADPKQFDCSELVKWAAARSGVDITDLADYQLLSLRDKGAELSVEEALRTPGALLFRMPFNPSWATDGVGTEMAHVAISLGDGRTIEARGSKYGVLVVDAETNKDRFNYAGRIPELRSASGQELAQLGLGGAGALAGAGFKPPAVPLAPLAPTSALLLQRAMGGRVGDADHDGIADGLEDLLGLSSANQDSDNDGLSDSFELLTSHTNPTAADSDGDSMGDALEMVSGRNAKLPDGADGAGQAFDLFLGAGADTDQDGVSDTMEDILGLSKASADSDGDGLADAFEILHKLDPNKADSKGTGVPDSLAALLGINAGPGSPAGAPGPGSPLDLLNANVLQGQQGGGLLASSALPGMPGAVPGSTAAELARLTGGSRAAEDLASLLKPDGVGELGGGWLPNS